MSLKDLAQGYSANAELIAQLRAEHPVFDEICGDYEAVLAQVAALSESEDAHDPKWHACLEETLGALRQEIFATLEEHTAARTQTARNDDTQTNTSTNGDKHAL